MPSLGDSVRGGCGTVPGDCPRPAPWGRHGHAQLLIHQETRAILGVHAIGTGATELIHVDQAVMAFGGTVDYFVHNVFNFPTLAEAYKVAALNGVNKLALV